MELTEVALDHTAQHSTPGRGQRAHVRLKASSGKVSGIHKTKKP